MLDESNESKNSDLKPIENNQEDQNESHHQQIISADTESNDQK